MDVQLHAVGLSESDLGAAEWSVFLFVRSADGALSEICPFLP